MGIFYSKENNGAKDAGNLDFKIPETLSHSLNIFGFEVLKKSNINENQNVIFSPYSAFICIAMSISLFKSQTKSEILKSLQIPEAKFNNDDLFKELRRLIDEENTNSVFVSNHIWVNADLNFDSNTFLPNEQILGIPIEKVSFPQPGADQINQTVSSDTNKKIINIVDEKKLIDISMILLNAIFFDSKWEKPFQTTNYFHGCSRYGFQTFDGNSIEVTVLESRNRELPFFFDRKCQIVSIPYLDKQYDFVIVLPNKKTIEAFENLKNMSYQELNECYLKNMKETSIHIRIPKFSFNFECNLKEILKSLGMNKAFLIDEAECVDKNVPYFISSVIQKVRIEVDENGTRAAAATATIGTIGGGPWDFSADHPFLYLIRNINTGTILFEGFFINPKDNT